MRIGRGSRLVAEAVQLAGRLVIRGVPEEEAVGRLRELPCGPAGLREAAASLRGHGFPANRAAALLLAAADGTALPAMSNEERGADEQERQLAELPLDEAFGLLARRLPELRELERRARDGGDSHSLLMRMAIKSGDSQAIAMRKLARPVKDSFRLVGPESGQLDRLLASAVAANVVRRHLAVTAGVVTDGTD